MTSPDSLVTEKKNNNNKMTQIPFNPRINLTNIFVCAPL